MFSHKVMLNHKLSGVHCGTPVLEYDARDPGKILGGLVLTKGTTNTNSYSMMETIQNGDHPFRPGKYFTITASSLTVNDEPWLVRTVSVSIGTSATMFHRWFVITGESAVDAKSGSWWGFEAAHTFPLACEEHWNYHDYGSINSVQNAILLQACVQILFDNYAVIVWFRPNCKDIAGRHLDEQLLGGPSRAVDQLLHAHEYEGVVEPAFEFDFLPGSDMMGEIMSSPKADGRVEFELFGRLARPSEVN
ncbi:hypothetical protein L873DRAFT_1838618 [Choiromyces venosus 120613-1]|uniref:Uncharacterized protein n=1 Tax=Choiromyces venosus 120613-1 TaxID=1336337 RepID=A0A3N4J0M5_9PEZI|nr:hypothetical protein L873DRAFT_1838618 [Choiromyces venosus 120613-1]